MKNIFIVISLVLAVIIAVFFIEKIDDETGGWDTPKDYKTFSKATSIQIPVYSDSIYFYWLYRGTQDRENWVKFKISYEDKDEFINELINTREKEIGIGINKGINFEQAFSEIDKKPKWFKKSSNVDGTLIRLYFLGILTNIYWVDTTEQQVYLYCR